MLEDTANEYEKSRTGSVEHFNRMATALALVLPARNSFRTSNVLARGWSQAAFLQNFYLPLYHPSEHTLRA